METVSSRSTLIQCFTVIYSCVAGDFKVSTIAIVEEDLMKLMFAADFEILNLQPKITRKEPPELQGNEPTSEACFDNTANDS